MLLPEDPASQLRAATRKAHEQVESLPVFSCLLGDDVSLDDLRQALIVLHRFHAAVEPKILDLLAGDPLAGCFQPALTLLAADLAALGVAGVSEELCPLAMASAAEAWGAVYVLEGSALGGQFIAKHLREHLADRIMPPLSYYQRRTPGHWPEVLNALRQALPDRTSIDAAEEGALGCFVVLNSMAKSNGRNAP